MSTSPEKPNRTPSFRWSTGVACVVLTICAVGLAFPKLVGSSDDPEYGWAICILSLAFVFFVQMFRGDRK